MIHRPPPVVQTAEDLLLEFERTGDPAPFEEIVRRYSGMVYGVCYRVTRNAHDAEDATQATFLKLATQARTTNGVPRVGPWLQQVAKTTAVDLRRSRTRRQTREQVRAAIVDQQQEHVHAADEAGMDELKQLLRDEVDRLPVHYRTPLILYYFGGLSTEQIAVELKSNAKALAVRLFRARKMLGGRLKDRGIASAGGALVCLTVADAIVAGLAKSAFPAAPAACAAAGGYAAPGASAWLTSHNAVMTVLGDRIAATLRTCALAGVAGKWKVSIALLLSVGTAMAGTTNAVRNAPVLREIGGWLEDLNSALNGVGRYRNLFRNFSAPLRAEAQPPADPATSPPAVVAVPAPSVWLPVGPAEYSPPAGSVAGAYPRPAAQQSMAAAGPASPLRPSAVGGTPPAGGTPRLGEPVRPLPTLPEDRLAGGGGRTVQIGGSAGGAVLAMQAQRRAADGPTYTAAGGGTAEAARRRLAAGPPREFVGPRALASTGTGSSLGLFGSTGRHDPGRHTGPFALPKHDTVATLTRPTPPQVPFPGGPETPASPGTAGGAPAGGAPAAANGPVAGSPGESPIASAGGGDGGLATGSGWSGTGGTGNGSGGMVGGVDYDGRTFDETGTNPVDAGYPTDPGLPETTGPYVPSPTDPEPGGPVIDLPGNPTPGRGGPLVDPGPFFGSAAPPPATQPGGVPEPTAAGLLAAGAIGLLARRQRRERVN